MLLGASPFLVAHFTKGGDYLQEISFQDQLYLGKAAPLLASMQQLEDLEAHIRSILARLVPSSFLNQQDLMALAIPLLDGSPFKIDFAEICDQ